MVGSTISHYRIIEKLGQGGMGVVYKAEDVKLRRPVALKTLPENCDELRARLLLEAEAAASLNHPNICTIYEVDDEHLFIAMEFVDGETLAHRIKAGPLPLDEALRVVVQTGRALDAAHRKGVTHRDVKSANIMLTRSGETKLMDFGLALSSDLTRISAPGMLLGTPAYMSPEQASGNTVDARTDIWALGVVLYEAIAGQLPFRGSGQASMIHAILSQTPEPLTSCRSGLPMELDRIVGKALAKDPAERYQHVDEMVVDLELLRNAGGRKRPQTTQRPSGMNQTRRRALVAAAAILSLTLLLFWTALRGGFGSRQIASERTPSIAVLPLSNLSRDTAQEYFSDGITDALITELGRIAGVRVISRTSVMRYKSTEEPVSKIARELGVTHVLEGSVAQDKDQVRISARLIRASADEQVWTGAYERDLKSILRLQQDVARAVASEIGVRFRSSSGGVPASVDPAAYRAYLLGLQYANEGPVRAAAAMDQFERAIRLDPHFAPSFAALAWRYAAGGGGQIRDRHLLRRKAVELATQALELDPESAEAWDTLGWVRTYFDFDWDGAHQAFRRALELNPSSSQTTHHYSHYLMLRGRVDEALAAGIRATELSPFDRVAAGHHVWDLFMARQYDQAISYSHYARQYAYRVYDRLGDFKHALSQNAERATGADIGRAHALSGATAEARRIVREMVHDGSQPFAIALIYVALGDEAAALDWLEKGYELRSYPLPEISIDPRFDDLRAERRFRDLLQRIGLDDEFARRHVAMASRQFPRASPAAR
jgi:eukaryotic-like serine/threonine-protein kinase